MYLENPLPKTKVLITVKTYPAPTPTQKEVVCTAGLVDGKKWVRIYPINFRDMSYSQQFPKYSWIQMDLQKNQHDFRVESYQPTKGFDENIKILSHIGTDNNWEERRSIICKGEVFHSMTEAISLAKNHNRSLVTFKPKRIIDFIIEPTKREWSDSQKRVLQQQSLFDFSFRKHKNIIRKLPYKYSYKFISEGDSSPRKLMITDWEIGALFWKCLDKYKNEEITNQKIKEKYLDHFCNNCDIHFFLGTTYRNHVKSPNPYIIIGVFYPPLIYQEKLL